MGYTKDAAGLQSALESLEALSESAGKVHLDDSGRLYNTNLLESLRLKAGIRLAIASTRSAMSRTESRGTHQRSDFEEEDAEQLHHTLVDSEGNLSTLAISPAPCNPEHAESPAAYKPVNQRDQRPVTALPCSSVAIPPIVVATLG